MGMTSNYTLARQLRQKMTGVALGGFKQQKIVISSNTAASYRTQTH